MKRLLLSIALFCIAGTASAQEPEPVYRERGIETPETEDDLSLPDISNWIPVEKFAEQMQADPQQQPKSTFSTSMVIPKTKPKTVVVSPDNSTVKFGKHFSISNGNAGNWGSGPGTYLDARTLSFPAPRPRMANGGRR